MSKDRDVIDALLIAGFFAGYALVLAIAKRVPRPATPVDIRRLTFMRDMRGKLIEQENMRTIATTGHLSMVTPDGDD